MATRMNAAANAVEQIDTAGDGNAHRRPSNEVDWAWARIFSDFEQRPAVFTDPRQPDNPIEYATPAFRELTGYTLDELVGRNCRLLQGPDTDPEAIAAIRAALAECLPITVDLLNYRRDGAPFWNRLRIKPVIGPGGVVQRYIGVQTPIDAGQVRPGPYPGFAA